MGYFMYFCIKNSVYFFSFRFFILQYLVILSLNPKKDSRVAFYLATRLSYILRSVAFRPRLTTGVALTFKHYDLNSTTTT
jgi:hypothetical protein